MARVAAPGGNMAASNVYAARVVLDTLPSGNTIDNAKRPPGIAPGTLTVLCSVFVYGAIATPFCAAAVPAENGSVIGDGAWCWFSEPKAIAILTHDGERIVTGWVSKEGDIVAALVNPVSGAVESHLLHAALERDDHDHPAFVTLPDGRISAFYAKHGKETLYVRTTDNQHDISHWSGERELRLNNPELTAKFDQNRYTYANPWRLSGENNGCSSHFTVAKRRFLADCNVST